MLTKTLSAQRLFILFTFLGGLGAAWYLGLSPRNLLPHQGGLSILGDFLRGAFSPALTYQSSFIPPGTPPLLLKACHSALLTIQYAAAAIGLSLCFGFVLAFLGSTAWWTENLPGGKTATQKLLRFCIAPTLYFLTRIITVLGRSVHELLWALLFLCAIGLTPLTAVLALSIPYSATFAKIFSEMIDETPRHAARTLQANGASPLQLFLFAFLPQAFPEIIAYTFYRFECALRSAAVLGFLGIPTLGYYIQLSFENLHYREVWTYLYTLFVLIILFELWSHTMRKRLY